MQAPATFTDTNTYVVHFMYIRFVNTCMNPDSLAIMSPTVTDQMFNE